MERLLLILFAFATIPPPVRIFAAPVEPALCPVLAEAVIPRIITERDFARTKLAPLLKELKLEIVSDDADPAGHSIVFFAKDESGNVYVLKTPKVRMEWTGELPTFSSNEPYVLALRKEVALGRQFGKHDNLIQLPEKLVGEKDYPFLVMPYGGRSLAKHFRDPRFELLRSAPSRTLGTNERKEILRAQLEVIDIVLQAAGGLERIHATGFAHGDIKPANLLIDGSGKVIVTDFGLTTKLTEEYAAAGRVDRYSSPRQRYARSQASVKDDIYSLQVMLVEMKVGPYRGKSLGMDAYDRFESVDQFVVDLKRVREEIVSILK